MTPSLSRGRGRAARASHLDSDRNQRLRVAPRHPSARSLGELASPRGHEPGHGLAARLARTAVHLSPKQSKHSKCKLTRRAASVRNAPCAPPPHPLAWHYPHVRVIFGASGAPRAEAWILRRTSAACGRGCDSAPQCFVLGHLPTTLASLEAAIASFAVRPKKAVASPNIGGACQRKPSKANTTRPPASGCERRRRAAVRRRRQRPPRCTVGVSLRSARRQGTRRRVPPHRDRLQAAEQFVPPQPLLVTRRH